jgi:uncharacterized protein YlxW (UPF0749 family)
VREGPQNPTPTDAAGSPNARTRWSVGVVAVSVLAGFLLVAGASASDGSDLRAERRTDLTDLVRAREADIAVRTDRLAWLEDEVSAMSAATPTPQSASGEGAADGEVPTSLEVAAGAAPVSGPGLTVQLDDAPRQPGAPLPDGVRPDDLVVHQQDLQSVVNALWRGGAKGMRIMDQRVVSTSAVRCVGNTLILQGRVYSPPFRIAAVGEPDRLAAALDDEPGVKAYREWSQAVGLGYDVTRETELLLDGYDGPLDLSYAKGAR